VDFPPPEGPTRAVNFPSGIIKLILAVPFPGFPDYRKTKHFVIQYRLTLLLPSALYQGVLQYLEPIHKLQRGVK
jgi:hypothetical protein